MNLPPQPAVGPFWKLARGQLRPVFRMALVNLGLVAVLAFVSILYVVFPLPVVFVALIAIAILTVGVAAGMTLWVLRIPQP